MFGDLDGRSILGGNKSGSSRLLLLGIIAAVVLTSQLSNKGNTFLIDVEALLGVPGINQRLEVHCILCVAIDVSSIKRSRKKGSFQLLCDWFYRFFVLKDTLAKPVQATAPVLRVMSMSVYMPNVINLMLL